mgnify:CR=1 FL=1
MEIDIKIDDKKASEIKRLILNLLNPSGKLDCGAAFKIAAKLGVDAGVVGDLAARTDRSLRTRSIRQAAM